MAKAYVRFCCEMNGRDEGMNPNTLKRTLLMAIGVMAVFMIIMFSAAFIRARALANKGVSTDVEAEPGNGMVFPEGILVDGIDLKGKKLTEALDLVLQRQDDILSQYKVTLVCEGERKEFLIDESCYTDDVRETLNQAFMFGRNGTPEENKAILEQLKLQSMEFTTHFTLDLEPMRQRVVDYVFTLGVKPINAAVKGFDSAKPIGQQFEYTDEVAGTQADPEKVWDDVQAAFDNKQFGEIPVTLAYTEPNVTIAKLKDINQKIVSFSSKMKKDANRISNITLSCETIDGFILMPGEEFSFNTVVGPRSLERGYKEAGVIVGGDRLDTGLGGGICQVSGTLYNAVLRADLQILERYHHSFELTYLTRGTDATVDYGKKDLRFKNNRNTPVYIVMSSDPDKLTVNCDVYGEPLPDGKTIKVLVETIETVPASTQVVVAPLRTLEAGKTQNIKAIDGFKCNVFKAYYDKNDKQLEKKLLYTDYYQPVQPKIYYSPKDPPPTVPPDPSADPSPSQDATETPTLNGTPTPSDTMAPTSTPSPTPTPTPTPEPSTPPPTEEPTADVT